MGTYGDIRTRFEMALNEANLPKWKELSKTAYDLFMPKESGGRWISQNPEELIRAYFGSEDTEENIQKFLELNGVRADYYSDVLVPANKSGSFASWAITIKTDCTWFGKILKSGETWYIINAKKVSNSGVTAVIGDKDTTPSNLRLTDTLFRDIKSAVNVTKEAVKYAIKDENYASFMNSLVDAVASYNPSSKFDDILGLAKSDNDYSIDYDFSQWGEDIDLISIKNIQKDFGEVLGGILTFNLIKKVDSGLIFPGASNEAVVDFKFDNLNISSKADKGGKASASGYMKKVNSTKESENWTLSKEEEEFDANFTNILLAKQSEPKNTNYYKGSNGSGTFSNTVNLFNIHLTRNSGWNYWESTARMATKGISRDTVVQSFVDLKEAGNLYSVLKGFAKSVGGFGKLGGRSDAAKYTQRLLEAKNEKAAAEVLDEILKIDKKDTYDAIVGIIMYGCSKQLVDVLNKKYGKVMTGMINKALSAKQLYLIVNIKKNSILFQMKSMKTSNFKIDELNGVNSWDQRGLAITLVK